MRILSEHQIWERLKTQDFDINPGTPPPHTLSMSFAQEDGSIHTPLSFACTQNDIQLVKSLLAHGADPLAHFSPSYITPDDTVLHAAMFDGTPELFEVLFEGGVPFSPLYGSNGYEDPITLALNNLSIPKCFGNIQYLVERGVDVNRSFEHGKSYLIRAIEKNEHALVQLLLEASADPNLPNASKVDSPAPPLYFALRSKEGLKILDILKSFGADSTWKDSQGNNLFYVFTAPNMPYQDLSEKVKWLLRQGVSLEEKNKDGLSLFQHTHLSPLVVEQIQKAYVEWEHEHLSSVLASSSGAKKAPRI